MSQANACGLKAALGHVFVSPSQATGNMTMLMITPDGRTLSYDVSGAGAPIVFVAGLGERGTCNRRDSFGVVVPMAMCRGIAVISHAVGLVAHITEKMRNPLAREIWERSEQEISENILYEQKGVRGDPGIS
jgi:hypothetical protein